MRFINPSAALGSVAAVIVLSFATGTTANAQSFTQPITFLTGAQERPTPVTTSGVGAGGFTYDQAANTLTVSLSTFSLTSNIILAHIHLVPLTAPDPTAVNGPATFDIKNAASLINPAIPAGNGPILNSAAAFTFPTVVFSDLTPTQVTQLRVGYAYFNVHTTNFPAGEVRGNIASSVVAPEPGTLALAAVALFPLGLIRRRKALRG
ncbi:MAG: CHRD domain-containing protein [Cytophagales bacterium]|nr:CHRD domain-containing protein [Armatimonadota bacterium]